MTFDHRRARASKNKRLWRQTGRTGRRRFNVVVNDQLVFHPETYRRLVAEGWFRESDRVVIVEVSP